MDVLDLVEDVLIISDREARVRELIRSLMSGEKSLSFSALKNFKISPDSFIQYSLREKVTTDAMIFGTIVHCLVLEPDQFHLRYFVLDDEDICNEIGGAKPRSTNAYKEWRNREVAFNPGKEMIKPDVYQHAEIIANNVRFNYASKPILDKCTVREDPLEWEYKNFKFRGIIDARGEKAVFDLKTCANADPKKFQRDIIEMGYHIQAAMYLTGLAVKLPYYIIACDKKGGVSVHKISNDLMEYGFKEYERLLDSFNECLLKEKFDQSFEFWSEWPNGIFIADKPAYLY